LGRAWGVPGAPNHRQGTLTIIKIFLTFCEFLKYLVASLQIVFAKTMKTQAGEVFQDLEQFDAGIRKIIPYYDIVLDQVSRQVPAGAKRVLELGSGTGELSLRILDQCPEAKLYAVDYSDRMHQFFHSKLKQRGLEARVELIESDIAKLESDYMGENTLPFDACVSSFTIHHLPDAAKARVVTTLSKLLKPGAGCWIVDSMAAESPSLQATYQDARRRWMQTFDVEEDAIIKQMVLPKPFGHSDDHFHSPASTYTQLLKNSGFESVDILFKYYGITACCGFLPDPDAREQPDQR
jgi:trans-aconitate 2-methyltransferase